MGYTGESARRAHSRSRADSVSCLLSTRALPPDWFVRTLLDVRSHCAPGARPMDAQQVLRATKLAAWGPSFRDREIFFAAESGEPPARIARREGLAVRTVQNIVRRVRDQLAREAALWWRLSVEQLLAEEERLQR